VWRILRAFVWLRWRTLLNSLERRGSRDVLERFSVALEQLAPTLALVVMVPSMLSLASLAAYAGWSLTQAEPRPIVYEIVRYALFAGCLLAVAGPVMLPGGDRTNAVRMLLLPIPRPVLYAAHVVAALADPWLLLVAAVAIGLPVGLAAGGALLPAGLAAAAGLLLVVTLVAVALAVTSAVHLLVRDRRRGELLALAVVVLLPMIGFLPMLLGSGRRHRAVDQPPVTRSRSAIERQLLDLVPSELYVRTVRSVTRGGLGEAARPATLLVASGAAVHALAFLAFLRVLASPGSAARSRRTAAGSATLRRIPGTSPGTSAVAINQIRLALRSPRGRATLLSPLVVLAMFTMMTLRSRGGVDVGPLRMTSGLGLAAFTTLISLISTLPLAMNQFAIDRAGLTLAMLAPLPTVTLLHGKAIGNGVIAAIPAALCLTAAALVLPGGNPLYWVCIPLTAISAYILVAPLAAILSALFPRAVDLNSIGRGSNAHGAAGLLGMLAYVIATAPGAGIVAVSVMLLERPVVAPAALVVWILVSLAISLWFFRFAADIFDRRRENLGLTARGTAT
jgi:hypothetical protein